MVDEKKSHHGAPRSRIRVLICVECDKPFTAHGRGRNRKTCSGDCARPRRRKRAGSPAAKERAVARKRNREHLRRSDLSDITAEQELAMRKRTRKCPMCGKYMTSKPNQPNSKHLDHIVPINQGGTHTHGNVRIICADCNLHRPKDGSDFVGQLTLWASGPLPLKRPRKKHVRTLCGKGLHPWTADNIGTGHQGKRYCLPCWNMKTDQQKRRSKAALQKICRCGALFAAPGNTFMCADCTDRAARRAAELHAAGMEWLEIARQLGYTTGEGVRYAAKRIGYAPTHVKKQKASRPLRRCACGESLPCAHCYTRTAFLAVGLRVNGWTLEQIGVLLGYASKTSVTSLMRAVVHNYAPWDRSWPMSEMSRR